MLRALAARRLSTSLAAASASTSKSLAEVKAAAKAAALQEPLTVYARKRLGGRSPDVLKKKGYIPAVIQGDFLPNQHIALDAKSLYALRRRRGFKTRMIALRMGDGEVIQCLPESLQETLDDGHIVRAASNARRLNTARAAREAAPAAAARRRAAAAASRAAAAAAAAAPRVPPPDARDARRSFRSTCGAGRATRCATR